ncbi:MAG: hypothetical protein IKZ87_00835 [Actinomycetaceae bacterium]|nr:hypothetical protein [Actinomycetaceae bacterium]
MSDNLLSIGISRNGSEVLIGDTEPKQKTVAMQCFLCRVHGYGGCFKTLLTKKGQKNICPLCAGVIDIEYLDRNNRKVKKEGTDDNSGVQEGESKPDWNADLAWIPDIHQMNINNLVLMYHITSWMYSKACGDNAKIKEQASMREFLDILDNIYMNVFKKGVEALKKREDVRMDKIPEAQKQSTKPPKPIYDLDSLARVLKSMPISEYERRESILLGLRIIPRDLSHIDKSFIQNNLNVSLLAAMYAKHHPEVKGLIPAAPAQRSASGIARQMGV